MNLVAVLNHRPRPLTVQERKVVRGNSTNLMCLKLKPGHRVVLQLPAGQLEITVDGIEEQEAAVAFALTKPYGFENLKPKPSTKPRPKPKRKIKPHTKPKPPRAKAKPR